MGDLDAPSVPKGPEDRLLVIPSDPADLDSVVCATRSTCGTDGVTPRRRPTFVRSGWRGLAMMTGFPRSRCTHPPWTVRSKVRTQRGGIFRSLQSRSLGAPFLALLYVDPAMRGRGIGLRLLEDFEGAHGPQVFTSTNLSNEPMQRLLRLRLWKPCGMLNGLDEGDPEIFFSKAL